MTRLHPVAAAVQLLAVGAFWTGGTAVCLGIGGWLMWVVYRAWGVLP